MNEQATTSGSQSDPRSGAASRITVRDAVFDLFRRCNLTTIFGNPGSTELPMYRDFPEDFRYVLGLQECVAVGMADGFAQATRNAAVVNLHSAVGVGHAMGNIFTAFRNQTPLIITAGQQARSILPYEPFLYSGNATELPRPYVKWSCEPARAEDVPVAIARAYHVAMQPPCGPTFVSIPVDDWDQPATLIQPRRASTSISGDPVLLAEASLALTQAERPVMVVGASVARDGAWDEVISLAERHQSPVWVAPMSGRNSFPERHRLFAGFLAASREKIVDNLDGHDLILVLGAPVFTMHVEGFGPFIPAGAQLFQLTDNPETASFTPVGVSIVTSLKLGIRSLLAAPEPRRRAAPRAIVRPARLPPDRLSDKYLLQQIAALRPPGSIIVEEAPSSRGPMHDYLPIDDKDSFYTCASGGLGHGLPAAIGVALGRPGEKVIAIIGDGSAMYAIQGLSTAAELELPMTFIVIKNGSYEALNEFAGHFGLSRVMGSRLPPLDFCGLAQSQGIQAARVTAAGELDGSLQAAFRSERAMLLEIYVGGP